MRIQRPTISQPTITEPTITAMTSLTGDGASITGSFSGSFAGELTGPTSASFAESISANSSSIEAASSSLATSITGVQSNLDNASSSLATSITTNSGNITTNSGNIISLQTYSSSLDTNLPTLALPANTTISTFGASLADDADATAAKTTLGLENVTNESKATMFTSPAFSGTPTAPTPITTTDSTQVATTAFVQDRIQK